MSDEADQAQAAQEHALNVALANRVTGNEHLTGFCHWCDKPTKGAFCSKECRIDSDKLDRMKL